MTYPPQPGQPYGQQPDPYGQGGQYGQGGYPQQGGPYGHGAYPQPGGYPQQGGQYGQGAYPQPGAYLQPGAYPQPGGYGQYGQPYPQPPGQFGPPGSPGGPPKKKTGLWVGLSTGLVVILAVFGIGGFVWPAFFLNKEADEPEKVAQSVVDALNAKDVNKINQFKCPNVSQDVTTINDGVSNARLGEVKTVSDNEATASITANYRGEQQTVNGTLNKSDDKWCWNNFKAEESSKPRSPSSSSPSSSSSSPSSPGTSIDENPEAINTMQQVLDAINSGDSTSAQSMICEADKGIYNKKVTELVSGHANLTMTDPSGYDDFGIADVKGTVDGNPVSDGSVGSSNDSGKWCVDLLGVP